MSSKFDPTTAPRGSAKRLSQLRSYLPHAREIAGPSEYGALEGLAWLKTEIEVEERIAAMPAARGGFDRTATQTPDPVDVEIPMPGLLPDPEEKASKEQPQADACDCFGCLFYGRCTRAMVPLANYSVQDLGMAAKPGPTIPAWEIEMSRRLDAIRQQMDNALVAGHEAGRIERAADIVRDGSLDAARDKYECTTAACNCPDSIHRGATCKHKIAEIMAHNLRQASRHHLEASNE